MSPDFKTAVVVYDLLQTRHSILRNFPIIGHFRYWLEAIGPGLRQYIVTGNDEERPFSRDERRWVYASSKLENNYFGFGTDNDLEATSNYLIIKHSAFPRPNPYADDPTYDPEHRIACAEILGEPRDRAGAFRPRSVVNISAMSFGSLSGRAIEALNRGAVLADCLHNTGEGGVSPYHRHGGDLVWQIGTGYFGCRDRNGRFDIEKLLETVSAAPIRAMEIELSQGAKPGLGGVLPAPRSHRRSRRSAESKSVQPASVRHGTANSPTSTACSTSSSFWPPSPDCPSASNPRLAISNSGASSRQRCRTGAEVSISLRSTAERAVRVPDRWRSPTTWRNRSRSDSARSSTSSPSEVSPIASSSLAPGSWDSRAMASSPLLWAGI